MSRIAFAILVLVGTPAASPTQAGEKPFQFPEAKHGKGELRYMNGIPVVLVQGTPEQIGEQLGVLAVKPGNRIAAYPEDYIKDLLEEPIVQGSIWVARQLYSLLGERPRAWLEWSRNQLGLAPDLETAIRQIVWGFVRVMSRTMLASFPTHHRRELEAMARASGVDRDIFLAGATLSDLTRMVACSTITVEGERSARNGPLFGRNFDFPSAGYLHHYTMVTVYRPEGKRAFASVGFPGVIGCFSGMNDAGLSVAMLEINGSADGSPKLDRGGIPCVLAFRRVLEECATVTDAEKLLRSMRRATRVSMAVCDPREACVFEMTPKAVVVRKPKAGVCLCTNQFRCDGLVCGKPCPRYRALEKATRGDRLDLTDVSRALHKVNQGVFTLQTMIFEPATLRLHLSTGEVPSSRVKPRELDLESFLKPR